MSYATADGSAKQPGDYSSTSGSVTFSPGDGAPKTVSVPINDDNVDELDENFTFRLSNQQNATIADDSGLGTIQDNDANRPPTASFSANPPQVFIAKASLLDARSSSDPERRPLSFAWDLDGNGSYETQTGSDPLVLTAFCTPGAQPLGLKVTDAGSIGDPVRRSATTTRTVDAVQASPDNSCDQVPPAVQIARINRSLPRALRRNLAVRLRCSEACTMVGQRGRSTARDGAPPRAARAPADAGQGPRAR